MVARDCTVWEQQTKNIKKKASSHTSFMCRSYTFRFYFRAHTQTRCESVEAEDLPLLLKIGFYDVISNIYNTEKKMFHCLCVSESSSSVGIF